MYKYGQGYWVRMMTAVMAGVLFLSCAAWTWSELEKVHIPTPTWQIALDQLSSASVPTPGTTVSLVKTNADGTSTVLGTGVVDTLDKEGRRATVRIKDPQMANGANPLDTNRVEVPGAATGAPPVFTAHAAQPLGIPLFPRVYLQAGVGALVMLLGCGLIYWYVGVKPGSVDFLIATDGEMKKVNWSTKKVIRDSTYVVIGATFLIAGVIALSDLLFLKLFQAIGLLGGS